MNSFLSLCTCFLVYVAYRKAKLTFIYAISIKMINYSTSDMEQIKMQHTKNTICKLACGVQLFLTAFFLKVQYANN